MREKTAAKIARENEIFPRSDQWAAEASGGVSHKEPDRRGEGFPSMNVWERALFRAVMLAVLLIFTARDGSAEPGRELPVAQVTHEARSFRGEADAAGAFTWWLPAGAEAFVLPLSAGVLIEADDAAAMRWLREGSPWELSELPVLGLRLGARTLVAIVPWPHYAELVVGERVGVRFQFPASRTNATPCELVARWCGNDPLEVATAFRSWRETAEDTGAIPRPRPLEAKAAALPAAARLFGAPHLYLWGPALFSRHDVDKGKWTAFARALREAGPETNTGRIVARFSEAERASLTKLADAAWAEDWLAREVASAVNRALADETLPPSPAKQPPGAAVSDKLAAFATELRGLTHEPGTWGDGFSLPMLESLRAAGLDRALLLLSDLHRATPRPDVVRKAEELGYLIGPYDSYHSVHDPNAAPDATWETAQFDQVAYDEGRVQNADGSGHAGFKGRGYHFAPSAAWPYVRKRVEAVMEQSPFTAWFVDCDATAECFDDFHPRHPATRPEDIRARRQRLGWLESTQHLVVGSEGGSVLFADVIHFGHGPQTPYLGHLAREFKDTGSASFLGRHWPGDTPAMYFKSASVPPSLVSPYFDPRTRIPLYRGALGDEVLVSHHWNFDSFKLGDVAAVRELMELLHMVPPLYHLNRETWPQRRAAILRHFAFWSPLHRRLATAPLVRFETLAPDRLLQRTTFRLPEGEVTITVNFGATPSQGYPPRSATAAGAIAVAQTVFVAGE